MGDLRLLEEAAEEESSQTAISNKDVKGVFLLPGTVRR
jgi:hypothetical protein